MRDCLHPVDLLPALNKQMRDDGARLGLGLRLRLRLSKAAGGRLQATGNAKAEGGNRKTEKSKIVGLTSKGISEEFSTEPPVSLYGASKRCVELLAMEYGEAFGFPVWINRCGVLAGKGQFGKADQGIFSFWIRSWKENRPLRYIGFDGRGEQVRDCLHPKDLVPVLKKQMASKVEGGRGQVEGFVNVKVNVKEDSKAESGRQPSFAPNLASSGGATEGFGVDRRICNFGGGVGNSCSLAQLSAWCEQRFGARKVESDPKPRPYDLPWVVMDSSRAKRMWGWKVQTRMDQIFEEIANG